MLILTNIGIPLLFCPSTNAFSPRGSYGKRARKGFLIDILRVFNVFYPPWDGKTSLLAYICPHKKRFPSLCDSLLCRRRPRERNADETKPRHRPKKAAESLHEDKKNHPTITMKKLLALLSLALPLLGASVKGYAQTPNPDSTPLATESVEDGVYYIASTSESLFDITAPYIAAASTSALKLVAKADLPTASGSTTGLWKITQQGAGTWTDGVKYYIQSLENGQSWSTGPAVPLGTAKYYAIIYDSDNGCYKIQGHTSEGSIGNKKPVAATSATAFNRGGDNNTWKLIPAYTTQTCTLNYTDDKGNTFSASQMLPVGTDIATAAAIDYYKDFTETSGKTVVEKGTETYNISCTADFPFEEGKFYTMKIRAASPITSGSCSVVWTAGSTSVGTRSSDSDIAKMGAYWRFERVANTQNQVRLANNAAGKPQYVTFANMGKNNSTATMGDAGTTFVIKPCNAGFRLCSTSSNTQNVNDISGNLGVWTADASTTDQGSTLTIALAAEQPSPVAFTVKNGDETLYTAKEVDGYYWKNGESVTDGTFQVANSYYTVDSSNAAYAEGTPVTLTASFPFAFTPSGQSGTRHWTLLRVRDDDTHLCQLNPATTGMQTRSTSNDMSAKTNVDNVTRLGQWAFVLKDGTFDQYYIVNRASGDNNALRLSSETQGATATMSPIASATAFYVAPQPSEFTTFTNGFTIQPNNTNTHAMGDHGSNDLTYWTNRGSSELNAAGSIFRVAEIAAETAAATVETANSGADTGFVGQLSIPSESLATLKTKTTSADFVDYYYSLLTDKANYTQPDASKLYRIYFKRGTRYPQNALAEADKDGTVKTDDATRKITTVAADDASVSAPSTVSRFVATGEDGVWYIQNANSDFYWGSTQDSEGYDVNLYAVKDAAYAGKYKVDCTTSGTATELGLIDTGITSSTTQYLNSLYGDDNTSSELTHYQANTYFGLDAGDVVYIKEVTEHPLTLKAEYATLCLPFAVTVPEGVTAYKVTDATTTELLMSELTGTVPAGTGMIVKGTAGATVSFPIAAGTDETPATDNKLTGVTVQRTGLDALSFYGLAKKNDHVAFYLSSVTEMPANKAYLLTSATAQSDPSSLSQLLDFNAGTPTGISAAAASGDKAADAYYDLSGRRVLYPSRGVYVKGNGQKVFLK